MAPRGTQSEMDIGIQPEPEIDRPETDHATYATATGIEAYISLAVS